MQASGAVSASPRASRRELVVTRRFEKSAPPISFEITYPSGHISRIGNGEPEFCIDIRTGRALAALGSFDELRICEAYMADEIDFRGDLQKAAALRDMLDDQNLWVTAWRKLQPLMMGLGKAQQAWVSNHYDSENLQLEFLDSTYNTYTPGDFVSGDESLEEASERKHRFAFEDLQLRSGDRLLDVGFGWGSFLRYAARRGVHVTGVTLSQHQLAFVQENLIDREGLPAKLHHENFFDFETNEQFDGVSMLGVMEELADYPKTMNRVARFVKPGGRVYLDFVAGTRDFVFPAFMTKYIYQGLTSRVYFPKFVEAVTRSPFEIVSVVNDRRNYHLTTQHWFRRFEKNRSQIRQRFGERAYRMYRLYLAGVSLMLDHPSHLTTAYRVLLELPTDARPAVAS